jgi:small ligand-binding sensory domain FIST
MLRAGAALERDPDPVRAARAAAERALAATDATAADAALLFATGPLDLARCGAAACEVLATRTLVAVVGHGVAAGPVEDEEPGAVVVLALAGVEAAAFVVGGGRGVEETIGPEVESLLGRSPRESDLVVAFADPLGVDPARLVDSLGDLAPACVVGAGAALDRPGAALLAHGGRALAGGSVCGIAFSLTEPARVATSQGCRRFGEPHVVTRAEGHWVLELDGKPALDVYADAAREPLAEDLRRAAERVLVALPRGAGDAWVARRLSGFAPARRAFALPEPPRVGSRLGFALRDADLAREDLRDALGRVAPARAALYLGASDRGQALFRHAGLEAAIVAQAFAPAPIAGLFGSFEIAPLGGAPAHLAHAGVVVALDGSV